MIHAPVAAPLIHHGSADPFVAVIESPYGMAMLYDETSSSPQAARRPRVARLSGSEVSMLLHAHTARRAMAYFDQLPPEQRELVREGKAVVKGYTWQIQGRDNLGRFQSVRNDLRQEP